MICIPAESLKRFSHGLAHISKTKQAKKFSSPVAVIQLRLELRTPSLKGMCSTY